MHTRKQINDKLKDIEDEETRSMLHEYYRLTTSYIPQLLNRFSKPDFPHKLKPATGFKLWLVKLINRL